MILSLTEKTLSTDPRAAKWCVNCCNEERWPS